MSEGDCITLFSIETDTLKSDGTADSYSRIRLKSVCPGDLWFDALLNGEVCSDVEKCGGYVQTGEITEDEESGLFYKAPVLVPTAELSGTMALTVRVTHQQSGDFRLIPVYIEIGEYVPQVQSEIRLSSEFGFEGNIELIGGQAILDLQAGDKKLDILIDENPWSDLLIADRITITAEDLDSGLTGTHSIPLGTPLTIFLAPWHDMDNFSIIPADMHFPVRIMAVAGGSREDPRWDIGQNMDQK